MDRTKWFMERKWGIFSHFLASKRFRCAAGHFEPEISWNDCVNGFDVEKYARTMDELHTGYVVFTLMQGTRYICAPNATFDRICGTKPGEACSERDLIMELADALAVYDIPLLVYYTGDGPYQDEVCGKAFGYHDRPHEAVTPAFVQKWTAVLEEFAVRYGEKVKGWWFDGFYPFLGYTEELIKPYKDAVLKGNPNAIVAFNNGVVQVDVCNPIFDPLTEGKTLLWEKMQILTDKAEAGDAEAAKAFSRPGPIRYSIYDDFTAGEENDFRRLPESRFTDGAQWHILSFIAPETGYGGYFGNAGWGGFGSKYSPEQLHDYVRAVNEKGGVVSIDTALYRDGSLEFGQLEVLKCLADCRQ